MLVDVLDVAVAIQMADKLDDLSSLTSRFIEQHNYSKFGVSYVRNDTDASAEIVPLSNIDEDFLTHYAEQDYFLLDPLAQYCLTTRTPFIWEEMLALDEQPTIVRKIYSEAADWGMPSGMTIPVHSFRGLRGSVTFAGDIARFGPRERMEMHILALVLHARVAELCEAQLSPGNGLYLTLREQETLKWGALGKTSDEIAAILGLTKRTVDQHFDNAARKLGTVNRVHTVVTALRHNLITL